MSRAKGLRRPLVSHNGELFREPKGDIAKPGEISSEEENRMFLTNLLFGSKQDKRGAGGDVTKMTPQYQTEIKAGRKAIQDRDIKQRFPNYAKLSSKNSC